MVRILTDSACDMPQEQAKALGIDIIPNVITFSDGRTINDGIEMSSDDFYQYMAKTGALPQTSHPGPEPYMRYYEEAKEAGDTVVTICLSTALSSLVSAATLGARMADYEDNVYIVDSYQASLSQQLQVRRALELRDEGEDAADIAMILEQEKRHTHLLGMVEDLDHLRRGGSLSIVGNIAGKAAGIKPLIEINGKVCATGMAKGWHKACKAIIQNLEDMGGINTNYKYMLGYSVDPKEVELLQKYITDKLKLPAAEIGQIGASVGTHVGPGTFGIVFYDTKPFAR